MTVAGMTEQGQRWQWPRPPEQILTTVLGNTWWNQTAHDPEVCWHDKPWPLCSWSWVISRVLTARGVSWQRFHTADPNVPFLWPPEVEKWAAGSYADTYFHKPPGEQLQLLVKNYLTTTLPEVCKRLKQMLTIHVTSASAERSFSILKSIQTYLRREALSSLWCWQIAEVGGHALR